MVTVSLPLLWWCDDVSTRGRGSEGENGGENGAQVEVPSRARSRAISVSAKCSRVHVSSIPASS